MNQGKVLVTGGFGLVGTALQSLQEDYPSYELIFSNTRECDLTSLTETLHYVEKIKPNAILHLAACRGGIGLSAQHPATLLRDNVLMNFSILEAARLCKTGKVVMSLSSGMYPADAPTPLREESIHAGEPHPSNDSYAFAKRLVEPSIRAYRKEYGLNVIGLVPNGIFGENDNFDPESATFIAALIKRFYDHKDDSSRLEVWGDGSPLREVTYVKDIARAFMWGLQFYDAGEILNIGTAEEHSIQEFAFMIAEELNIGRDRIVFDKSRLNGIFRKNTDNAKFVKASGFRFTPFKKGLKNIIQWLRDHDPQRFETKRAGAAFK